MAANIAKIATTTITSTNVNPRICLFIYVSSLIIGQYQYIQHKTVMLLQCFH